MSENKNEKMTIKGLWSGLKSLLSGLWGLAILVSMFYGGWKCVRDTWIDPEDRKTIMDLERDSIMTIGHGDECDFWNDEEWNTAEAFSNVCMEKDVAFRNCGIYCIDTDRMLWVYNGGIIGVDKKFGAKDKLSNGLYLAYFSAGDKSDDYNLKIVDSDNLIAWKSKFPMYFRWAPKKIGLHCPILAVKKLDKKYIENIRLGTQKYSVSPMVHEVKQLFKSREAAKNFDGMVLDAEAKTTTWWHLGRMIQRYNITNLKPEEYETGFYYGRIKYTTDGYEAEVSASNGKILILFSLGDDEYRRIHDAFGDEYYVMVITKETFK